MRFVSKIINSCLLSLLLIGCGQIGGSASQSLVLNENVFYPENEPPYIQIKIDEELITISDVDDYPSPPQISPDRLRMAFISPFEFEMIGHVWLYELSSEKKNKIATPDQNDGVVQSAKRVLWLDNDHLLILTGNAVGTVFLNRSLLIYSIKSGDLNEALTMKKNQSIFEINLAGNDVIMEIGEYNDDFSDYTSERKEMSIASLINAE